MGTGVVAPTRADRSQAEHPRRSRDLCDARAGSIAYRLGLRLARMHPFLAGFFVVAAGYLVVAVLVVGTGFLLTEVVLPGPLQRWDLDVVQDIASGRPDLNDPSVVGSYLAETVTVLAVTAVTVAICLWRKWFALAWLFVIAISLEGFLYLTATFFVTRTRPDVPRIEELINSDSYYSGHIAASVVVWVCVALVVWNVTDRRALRALALLFAAAAPVTVAVSRMYRGMHYPTDAIVGYLVGWACIGIALLSVRVFRVVAARRHQETAP
jgi:undecaprenyl-diphosphatase